MNITQGLKKILAQTIDTIVKMLMAAIVIATLFFFYIINAPTRPLARWTVHDAWGNQHVIVEMPQTDWLAGPFLVILAEFLAFQYIDEELSKRLGLSWEPNKYEQLLTLIEKMRTRDRTERYRASTNMAYQERKAYLEKEEKVWQGYLDLYKPSMWSVVAEITGVICGISFLAAAGMILFCSLAMPHLYQLSVVYPREVTLAATGITLAGITTVISYISWRVSRKSEDLRYARYLLAYWEGDK